MTEAKRAVGQRIRGWRKQRRLTQERLAAEAGISTRHLSFIETGRSRPGRDVLLRIAASLDLPPRDRDALLEAGGWAREPAAPLLETAHVLRTPAEVQALADPLRLDLLRAFGRPRSPKEAAGQLGVPPTRVYHHVGVLERAGLIRVVETRQRRGASERRYQAVAGIFRLGPTVAGAPGGVVDAALANGDPVEEGGTRTLAARAWVNATPEELTSLVRDLDALFARYEAAPGEGGRARYRFTVLGTRLAG